MCGGSDRFHVFADDQGWMCRKCAPEGGDILELIQRTHRCSFQEALDIAEGKSRYRAPTRKRTPVEKEREHLEWTSSEWQKEASTIIAEATRALNAADDARQYLEQRKISIATQFAYSVGYTKEKRAITLPWIAKDGRITAVKFRYVKAWTGANGKLQRFSQLAGGSQQIFGAHLLDGSEKPLVIIEGEFNAMSIYQCARDIVSVLSPGGDTNFKPMTHLLGRPGRKLLWIDSPDRAEDVCNLCRNAGIDLGNTVIAVSPHGKDANDILMEHGERALRSFVSSKIAGGHV